MIIRDAHQFEDFSSVMAVTSTYCTAESYIPGEYDLRIQKVGALGVVGDPLPALCLGS